MLSFQEEAVYTRNGVAEGPTLRYEAFRTAGRIESGGQRSEAKRHQK